MFTAGHLCIGATQDDIISVVSASYLIAREASLYLFICFDKFIDRYNLSFLNATLLQYKNDFAGVGPGLQRSLPCASECLVRS